MYLEMMSEMKHPGQFPKALAIAALVMTMVYMGVAVTTYHCRGDLTPSYMLDILENGSWQKRLCSVLMAYHVSVSYTMHHQVLARKIHVLYASHVVRRTSIVNHVSGWHRRSTWTSQLQWLVISCACGGVCWVIANVIPFFSDLVSLIGSVADGLLFYSVPGIFFLRACKTLPVGKGMGHSATAVMVVLAGL